MKRPEKLCSCHSTPGYRKLAKKMVRRARRRDWKRRGIEAGRRIKDYVFGTG